MGLKDIGLVYYVYNKLKGFKKKVKGEGNNIKYEKCIFNKTSINISGNSNSVVIGKGSKIYNSSIIVNGNDHNIILEDNCVIKNTVLWIEDEKCTLLIGNKTTIEGAHIAVTEPSSRITIGEDCMLSAGIDIRNGDSHSIIDLESGDRINYAKDIEVGDHVWIGNGAQILKGVTVGSNSIVGTRSIVTKDVPEKSIVTGVPAKAVKSNVTWDRERIYDT